MPKKQNLKAGGTFSGKRHSQGGVPIEVNGNVVAEGEVGEIIINRKSSQKHCEELSEINEEEGGVAINCQQTREVINNTEFKDGGKIERIPFSSPEVMTIIGKAHSNIAKYKREYAPTVHEIQAEIDRMIERGEVEPFDKNKMEEGGLLPSKEKLAQEFVDSLSPEKVSQIMQDFNEAKSQVLSKEKHELQGIEDDKAKLIEEKKVQDSLKNYNAAFEIRDKVRDFDLRIINKRNKILVLENNSDTISFTDKKNVEHKGVPDFSPINTSFISFDEETILTDPLPAYIPIIDEEVFREKGYIFDVIRIAKDTYILSTLGYKETKRGSGYMQELPAEDYEQGYVITTLDQLALISDYYYTKAKAVERAKANDRNKRTEDYYDNLPRERREKYFAQSHFYSRLPIAVKKKIAEDQWNLLTLEEKEDFYKPIAKKQGKRLVSKLDEHHMWRSFHEMYERFINPEAIHPEPGYANPEVWAYWKSFRYLMSWKVKDIKVQRQFESDTRSLALETSFGESNTNDELKEKYGILVKRQNGEKIQPNEIEQIRRAWVNINKLYGGLVKNAKDHNLKISHTGKTLVFASKAAGMYLPRMHTIAVSNKFGDNQFESIMAHEVAHWIDNILGEQHGRRYGSDDFESTAGIIGDTLRKNMNSPSDSDYINSTKECFARALEQYFAIETFGRDASLIYSYTELDRIRPYFAEEHYVSQEVYDNKLRPMIVQFMQEHKEFFKYDIVEPEVPTQELIEQQEKTEPTMEIQDIPKNNVTLYTKLKGEKNFKASDLNGNQVGNLVHAPLINPDKYLEFKKALVEVSRENPDIVFQIREFGTNKIFKEVINPDPVKVPYKFAVGDKVEIIDEPSFSQGKSVYEVVGHENYSESYGWETKIHNIADAPNKTVTIFENLLSPAHPLIGKEVTFRNNPEPSYTDIGKVVFRNDNGTFHVVFKDGSDGDFDEKQLFIVNENGVVIKDSQILKEKTVEEYKKDLIEIIDEEVKKYEDSKATAPENRFNQNKKSPREYLDEISKTLGIYWEEIVSKHPEEFGEFLLLQKRLPIQVRSFARDAANVEWNNKFKENLTVNLWTLIPGEFKEHKMPKKVVYNPTPDDKGLHSIMKDFIGHDDLRPHFNGVLFDRNGIVATDANKLLFIHHPSDREKEIHCITNDCFKKEEQVTGATYPVYERVIPNNTDVVSIHIESLITYLKTAIAIKYFNAAMSNVFIVFNDLTDMVFNAHFLLSGAEAMCKLGYDQVDIGFSRPNRAVTLCKKGELKNVSLLKTDFALIMPIMSSLDPGYMYFNAESECVATKGIADKSCLNPIHIEREKNEVILKKANEALAQVHEEKAKHETQRQADRIADKLMSINDKVWDALNIRSGGQLYDDLALQGKYKIALDTALEGKFTYPLSMKVHDVLENENQHSFNQYLYMSGAYGEEEKSKWFDYLANLAPGLKEYILSPVHYKIEEISAPEIVDTPASSNWDLKDAIEGLETMLSFAKGKEKKDLTDAIDGMKLLLPEKMAKGGSINNIEPRDILPDVNRYRRSTEDFELGTPVIHHSLDANGKQDEYSGQVLNDEKGMKTISLYANKNYSGKPVILKFNTINWNNVEKFSEANARGKAPFLLTDDFVVYHSKHGMPYKTLDNSQKLGLGGWIKNKFSKKGKTTTKKNPIPKEYQLTVTRPDGSIDMPLFNTMQAAESAKKDYETLGYKAIITPVYEAGGKLGFSGLSKKIKREYKKKGYPEEEAKRIGDSTAAKIEREKGRMEYGGNISHQCPVGTKIQSLILEKPTFSLENAKDWVYKHNFKNATKVDEKPDTYRFRQIPTGHFTKGSFRTIEITDGVKAIVACPNHRFKGNKKNN